MHVIAQAGCVRAAVAAHLSLFPSGLLDKSVKFVPLIALLSAFYLLYSDFLLPQGQRGGERV